MGAGSEATTRLDTSTRLAVDRTRLAHERTLMAWGRTAASLISFGFTIYKFFQFELKDQPVANVVIGPREFALLMIVLGLVILMLSTIQHTQSVRRLRAEFGDIVRYSTAAVVTGLISLLGFLALVAVLMRQ